MFPGLNCFNFLLHSMDEESVDLKSWIINSRFTEDSRVLRAILAALSVLERKAAAVGRIKRQRSFCPYKV